MTMEPQWSQGQRSTRGGGGGGERRSKSEMGEGVKSAGGISDGENGWRGGGGH